MTVDEIIKAVRWCIDEESNNNSSLADVIDEKDDSYMDNIIKAKINDALHWLSVTASSSDILSDSQKIGASSTTVKVETYDSERQIGVITLDANTEVLDISRIRGKDWHKAVIPVEDTQDDALMMFDDTAMGTVDRPQAAIMRETPLRILVQPSTDEVTISFVGVPKNVDTSSETDIPVPDKLKYAFVYYIAFLLLSAYEDTNANQMYSIAMQQLGSVQQSK